MKVKILEDFFDEDDDEYEYLGEYLGKEAEVLGYNSTLGIYLLRIGIQKLLWSEKGTEIIEE